MKYKMKSGGNKKPSKKMQMGGSFIEPNKELTFGEPKKYQKGGGMGPTAGRQANYGSRNKAAEAKNKAAYDLLSIKEKLTLSSEEKQKRIAERQASNKNKSASSPGGVTGIMLDSNVDTNSKSAAREKNDSAETKKAAEGYTRGQIGTPKKASSNNTNQGKASTTSGTSSASRPQKSNSSKPAPKPAPKQASTPAKKQTASTPKPKEAPSSAPKRPTPKASSDNRPGLAKSTTKNVAEGVSTSKKANRIDRRADKVADRKSKDRMANKAAHINKRAANVEARKEKKSEVAAAKARLKAARRLQTGGLKTPSEDQKGLKKLPTAVRNKMGYKKSGGKY